MTVDADLAALTDLATACANNGVDMPMSHADELAAGLQADNQTLKIELLRQQTAARHNLDPLLADRIRGVAAEDMNADARRLSQLQAKLCRSRSVTAQSGLVSGAGNRTDPRSPKQRAVDALAAVNRSGAWTSRS